MEKVRIAVRKEMIKEIPHIFLNILSKFFPSFLEKIGKRAVPINPRITPPEAIKENAIP